MAGVMRVARSDRTSDERGLSTLVGYALNVAIATLLVSALVVGVSTHVSQQRERAAATELSVLGQRIASRIMATDRLAQTADDGTVAVDVALPERVTGRPYRVEVRTDGDGGSVTLTIDDPSVSVSIEFRTETPVENDTVVGGPLEVTYDGAQLVVDNRE